MEAAMKGRTTRLGLPGRYRGARGGRADTTVADCGLLDVRDVYKVQLVGSTGIEPVTPTMSR